MTSNNSLDKNKSKLFSSYLNKINMSFIYAEKILIFSIFLLTLGIIFYVYGYIKNSSFLNNLYILEKGAMTANLFFILFLTFVMFAFAYKLLLDIYLWKNYCLHKPLIISILTLVIICIASFLSPFFAFLIILISALSVGFRIKTKDFIDIATNVTEKEDDKI